MSEEEEFIALRNTILYKYYKDYVEPLEREFDDLLEENKHLKISNTRYQNKIKGMKKNVSQDEFKRLRDQNVMLHEKIKKMELVIQKLRG